MGGEASFGVAMDRRLAMLGRWFQLAQHGTTVRRELLAGVTTFLTMAYIIFVQPAMLSGRSSGQDTGLDFAAVTAATCIASAVATLIMAFYARYPIALAPGMGLNAFFVFTVIPAAGAQAAATQGDSAPWRVALGAVFVSGVLFLLLTLTGLRKHLFRAVSPGMKDGIAVGIGLFIALIGLQHGQLVVADLATGVKINPHFASPDVLIFLAGLLVTAVLQARRVPGAILWGILATTLLAISAKLLLPYLPAGAAAADAVKSSLLAGKFEVASSVFSKPPSLGPTFLQMDVISALAPNMLPFVLVLLMMLVFDTLGTLIGVCKQAGLMRGSELPRVERAMFTDAAGTVVGACLGTSTVTAYIESAAGVEQGGRTGLVGVAVAVLFVASLCFMPIIEMVGNYSPITAPALVVVGCLMMGNVKDIQWRDFTESLPVFLTIIGIPFTYSIADGIALGLVSQPIVKLAAGRGREVHPLGYVLAVLLAAYFIYLR
jgi:AGZA family xanthine/uracil permease-like MFS transporter